MSAGSRPSTSPSSGEGFDYASDGLGHQPVLYHQIIQALKPVSSGRYIDGTVGAGGHAAAILDASQPNGQLLGLDLDPGAIKLAAQNLARYAGRVSLMQGSYTSMTQAANAVNWTEVDGILLDLGLSSMQLDQPQRGFSFREDAPLDMRFDPTQGWNAADLLNTLSEVDLAGLIWEYGEERQSRKIAKAICANRPIESTGQLATLIQKTVRGAKSDIHPATRTFQALRIAVNHELDNIAAALPQAISLLKVGGRLAVISFHSLEDRIVKQFFHTESRNCVCPPEQLLCTCNHRATLREISRKPIIATPEEVSNNPRSRSAKLRVVEKIWLA